MPAPRGLRVCLAALVLLVAGPPARACINGVRQTLGDLTEAVRQAERALHAGDLADAVEWVRSLLGDPFDLDDARSSPPPALASRAQRVLALAIARSGGALELGGDMTGRTAEERGRALAWATRLLQRRLARQPDDPLRQVDLAEALAWRPNERSQALILLRDLALADLLPEPRSWAVLAAVAAAEGMPTVTRFADARCRRTARSEHVCTRIPAPARAQALALAYAAAQ